MLSGMNTKDRTDLDKSIAAYTGVVTKVKPKRVRRHFTRTKSYGYWSITQQEVK
jgi:Uri superfamily endonuclease